MRSALACFPSIVVKTLKEVRPNCAPRSTSAWSIFASRLLFFISVDCSSAALTARTGRRQQLKPKGLSERVSTWGTLRYYDMGGQGTATAISASALAALAYLGIESISLCSICLAHVGRSAMLVLFMASSTPECSCRQTSPRS